MALALACLVVYDSEDEAKCSALFFNLFSGENIASNTTEIQQDASVVAKALSAWTLLATLRRVQELGGPVFET